MDNRERARARDKKQRRRILLERRENFISAGGVKMRNASGWQGEASKVKMSGSEKKNQQEHKQQNLWWAHRTFVFHKMCN